MTVHLSDAVRNAMLDAIETVGGTSVIFRLYSGPLPAGPATAASGTLLAEITLGSDWAAAASGGSKSFSSTPLQDATPNNNGTAGYWRLYKSDGTTCFAQGDVGVDGSGKSMILSSLTISTGVPFQILAWTLTAGNAGS